MVLRPEQVSLLWPGCAFLVAVLLCASRRLWPMLLLAGFLGFFIYDVRAGLTLRSTLLLLCSDTVEILVAAFGLYYVFGGMPRLNSINSLCRYLLVAVLLSPLSAAFVSPLALGSSYWLSWRICFLTEALAQLTITPAILGWVTMAGSSFWKRRSQFLEATALMVGLITLAFLTFQVSSGNFLPEFLYSLVPFLLWSALRFGIAGTSTSMIAIAFISVWGAVRGRGPFTGSDPLQNVLALQVFLLFAATPFMFLAAVSEQHKRDHEALRESDERFRLVANTAPVMIWMSGPDKLCNYFNQSWLDFTGRTIEAEVGNGWSDRVHPEDIKHCIDTYLQAFDRREEFRMEYRLLRHDGEYRWVLDIGVPRFTPDGAFAGYIGSAIDVTEGKVSAEQLAETSERLRLTMDAGGIVGWELDLRTGKKIQFGQTPGFVEQNSTDRSQLSQEFWEEVYVEDRLALHRVLEIAKENRTEFEHEFRVVRESGAVCWLRSRGKYVYSNGGDPERLVGISIEITAVKRAEEALRESEERLRLAVHAGKMFAYSWDVASDRIERSGESAQILGMQEGRVSTGKELMAMVHPDDCERVTEAMADLSAENPDVQITFRIIRPDETVIWLERNSRAYFGQYGNIQRIVGMVADVTERKNAEEILTTVNRRLIEAQEADRTRIARDLHDDIGQRLALLAVEIGQLSNTSLNRNESRARIAVVREQISEISSSVHGLSHQLHPSSLKHLGLTAAARSYCREISTQQCAEIDLKSDNVPADLPSDISLCLFRVLQESLQNAVKHSGANTFKVELRGDSRSIYLAVSDLGAGFNVESAMSGAGLGLISMRERLKLVNGELSIRSQKEHGTTIWACVPLPSEFVAARAAS